MSRSLHTQKLILRAARRLARPYSKRRSEAAYLTGRPGEDTAQRGPGKRLRIQTHKPLPGTLHPLSAQDIRKRLEVLGPAAVYGLKSIRLRRESAFLGRSLVFAEYALSGDIDLYAVPSPPWYLPFMLSPEDRIAFMRHGARVRVDDRMQQTTVEWTLSSLKSFYLYEVLAHELGHHRLQYHKGKRKVLLCRRSDHEKRAELYSRHVRGIEA
jgi:hypothetical protein